MLFLRLQNLNESLHFALHFELTILSFLFMERLLVEFIHNKDGFYCAMCFCGLGGVWLGQETCVALGKLLLKIEVQLPPQVIVFLNGF
jgi:hypothetical protein